MRSRIALVAWLALVGCGGDEAPPEPTQAPIVIDGRTGKVETPKDDHAGHDHAGHDHAADAGDAPEWVGGPGTLTVVYSNNVDGEIEPCG